MFKKAACWVAFVAGLILMVVDITPWEDAVSDGLGRLGAVAAILSGAQLMLWGSPVAAVWHLAYEKGGRDMLAKVNRRAVTPLPLASSDGWRR